MKGARWGPLALLASLGSCAPDADVAVIALQGTRNDSVYAATLTERFAARSPPIRLEMISPSVPGSYEDAQVAATRTLEIPGLVAVVGYRDSRSTLLVGPIFQDAGIPIVVPNATSSAIADMGPLVFSLVPDDREQGRLLVRAAAQGLGARTATLFHLTDEYGAGIRDGVLAVLAANGIELLDVVEYGRARVGCPDGFQALVDASLRRGVPDVVILGSRSADAGCIARLMTEGAPGVRFVAGDGVETDFFAPVAGSALEHTWFVRFFRPRGDSVLDAFYARYRSVTGNDGDPGTPLRWDAVELLVAGVAEAGANPARLSRWLRSLGGRRPAYQGMTGPISFHAGAIRPMILVDGSGNPVSQSGW